MNVADIARRMRGQSQSSGPQQSAKARALKAAVSEVLSAEAKDSPIFKMALPALNLISSDAEVDTTIGLVRKLIESFERHINEQEATHNRI
jgi:hypothetical protein